MRLLSLVTFLSFLVFAVVGHPLSLSLFRRKDTKDLKPQQDSLTFNITNLPSPKNTKKTIDVPTDCSNRQNPDEKCKDGDELEAVEVTFDDWNKPQTVCHCKKAELSLDDAIDLFSHVPVGLRQYIGFVMILPLKDGDLPHAITVEAGTSPASSLYWGKDDQRTWIHETSHATDGHFSWGGSQEWADAINKDTCVPDKYAQTNKNEDLAQVSVVKVAMVLNNGKIPDGFDQACMQNQLDFLDKQDTYKLENLVGKQSS